MAGNICDKWGSSMAGTWRGVCISLGLLWLRLWVGLMMLLGHGVGKLTAFSQKAGEFRDPINIGPKPSMALITFAEFFCAILIVLGLATRLAAIPLVFGMFVAAAIAHGDDSWSTKEKAMLYLVSFATLLITGPGRFSVDTMVGCLLGKTKCEVDTAPKPTAT